MHNRKIVIITVALGISFLYCTISYAHENRAIKIPVANLYSSANANLALISQAIYGARAEVVQKKFGWSLIKTSDDYQGWVKNDALGQLPTMRDNLIKVTNLFAYIYKTPDTSDQPPILLVPFDTRLPIIKIHNDRWIEVSLVDDRSGFIQQGDVTINPKPVSLGTMLAMSRKFIGLPYLWGGTSVYGFDCSGFVQFLYKQMDISLPRDSEQQVNWPGFIEVARTNLQPGDLIYFGWNDKISHAGLYLGKHLFINATAYTNPSVQINDLRTAHWRGIYMTARRLAPEWTKPPKFKGTITPLTGEMQEKMRQTTWHPGCPIALKDLAYLTVTHFGFDHKIHQGALIVATKIAPEVKAIFAELYQQKFPIEKMQPIEAYDGDDQASMRDNNTSAFNCRTMTDSANQYSLHSYGTAIDINPLINPYVNGNKVEPVAGAKYLDRKTYYGGKITLKSAAYQIFHQRGWIWGGSWPDEIKDYQHFEKLIRN